MLINKYFLYIVSIVFISSFLSFGIKQERNAVDIFMDIDYDGIKYLYNTPGGRVIKKLQHNIEGEDFILFSIIGRNDSMFHVKAYYSMKGYISDGWIKKDKHLGIYSRAYDRNLKLHKEPNTKSSIICEERYKPEMYIVIDSYGQWLKIKVVINGKEHKGWISPEMQCANVYSTCS